jgi:hypothetical protein
MATTFTWAIANLDRETSDGFVFTAHYTVSAADDTYSAGAYGSIGFERPDTLVPFAKVTEIEAALQSQLDEQRAPTKAAGLPWVDSE